MRYLEMKNRTMLVSGIYGVRALSSENNYLYYEGEFDCLWILHHNGTPAGFAAAWRDAKANQAKSMWKLIKPEINLRLPIVEPNDWRESHPTVNGVALGFLRLNVIQDFGDRD